MIIEQEQLASATGYSRSTDIRKCLTKQGIRVFRGKDGRVFCYSQDFDKQRRKEPNFGAITQKRQD